MSRQAPADAAAAGAQQQRPAPMSSQMQAVVRLLSGQEERTIAQKLADSNRPTWEQYKKDNEDTRSTTFHSFLVLHSSFSLVSIVVILVQGII